MNPHDELLMDAYLDGELPPAQARQMEAHLAQCPECQTILQRHRALSALLQEAPAAQPRKNANRFTAEVKLLLPRQAALPAPRSVAELVWRLAPVGLLTVIAFFEVALWITAIFRWIPGTDQLLAKLPGTASGAGWGAGLSAPLDTLIGLVTPFSYWNLSSIAAFAFVLLAALMYLGWLASWWAAVNRKNQVE